MKRILIGSCVLLAACGDMDVPDLNSPSEESLITSPTRTTLAAAATGLLIGARANYAEPNGYIAMVGILGRELYNLDAADTRFITEMLEAPQLNAGSPAFGGNFWNFPYANIRNGHNVLRAVDVVAGLNEEEKEATRGYVKTIQSLDFLIVISTRDTRGAPIDVDRGRTPAGSGCWTRFPKTFPVTPSTRSSRSRSRRRTRDNKGHGRTPTPLVSTFLTASSEIDG